MKLIHAISLTCAIIAFQTTVILADFSSSTWPLGDAIYSKNIHAVTSLLASGSNPNQPAPVDWSPGSSQTFAPSGDFFIISDRRPSDWTALMEAARAGNLPIVRTLLRHGTNPFGVNEEGRTALTEALERGNIAVALELADRGITITEEERTALPRQVRYLADFVLEATQRKREQREEQIPRTFRQPPLQQVGPDVEQMILEFEKNN